MVIDFSNEGKHNHRHCKADNEALGELNHANLGPLERLITCKLSSLEFCECSLRVWFLAGSDSDKSELSESSLVCVLRRFGDC